MTTKVLKIVFKLESNNKMTLTLSNPKEDITAQEINAFADDFIDSGIFAGGIGGGDVSPVSELVEAYYLEVTRTAIESSEPENAKKGGDK